MSAYYNEIDPYAAQWLRNLIDKGLIAPGVVDERSIEDVKPDELMGYTQCHFFAGIGVWSLALRRAGWPDNRPVWTGSCPCQPFSSAGKGSGFNDERHLWPHFQWLIEQCKPSVVAGEQVASKDAAPWIDLVQADLEALDYAFGAVAFPSAGVGAPHIRDRAYWVGHSNESGSQRFSGDGCTAGREGSDRPAAAPSVSGGMVNSNMPGLPAFPEQRGQQPCEQAPDAPSSLGRVGGMADTAREQHDRPGISGETGRAEHTDGCADGGLADNNRPGPTNGFWGDADWLFCRDGKWRPVKPGTFPLVDGTPQRVGRLRAYGNAINAEAATIFIQSVMELLNSSAGREFAA